ncbi:hypothetical protein SUGI_0509170 [Cryptomeria japonica]|nr:hypothetical protein SUGI_0509170 [Cryptomeria japonica]
MFGNKDGRPDGVDVPKGVFEREGIEAENGASGAKASMWKEAQSWVGIYGVEWFAGEAREGLIDEEWP